MVLGTVELREGSTYLEMIAYVNYSLTGAPIEKYILIQDISRVSKQKKELEYLAYFDTLTGICNRNFFVKKLQEYIDKASLMNTSVSLAMLDIDGFKRVNDSIGLILGDELIQDVGLFLKEFENECEDIRIFAQALDKINEVAHRTEDELAKLDQLVKSRFVEAA